MNKYELALVVNAKLEEEERKELLGRKASPLLFVTIPLYNSGGRCPVLIVIFYPTFFVSKYFSWAFYRLSVLFSPPEVSAAAVSAVSDSSASAVSEAFFSLSSFHLLSESSA